MAQPPLDADRGNGRREDLIEFSLPSRLELLGVLDQLVQAIAAQLEFNEDDSNAIATSLIEAATNAIQHGHQYNASRSVLFRFLLGPGSLETWVADSGAGFNLDQVLASDPTLPNQLFKSRGRGIYIMRAMMDTVEFDIVEGHGVTVHMSKAVPPAASSSRGAS
jgi:serine/threonine-protein kinase RsbW